MPSVRVHLDAHKAIYFPTISGYLLEIAVWEIAGQHMNAASHNITKQGCTSIAYNYIAQRVLI